jgi:hypothetical protein
MVAQAPIGAMIGGTSSAGRLGREPNRPSGWVIRLIGGFRVEETVSRGVAAHEHAPDRSTERPSFPCQSRASSSRVIQSRLEGCRSRGPAS